MFLGFADIEGFRVDVNRLPEVTIVNGVLALVLQLGHIGINDRHFEFRADEPGLLPTVAISPT